MKVKLNLRDILAEELGNIARIPATIHVETLFDSAALEEDYELEIEELIDVHELLNERRQVAVVWSLEDVQNVRPDLNDDQAWAVLQQCRRVHDCELGFTWLLIETVADDMFPEPSNKE